MKENKFYIPAVDKVFEIMAGQPLSVPMLNEKVNKFNTVERITYESIQSEEFDEEKMEKYLHYLRVLQKPHNSDLSLWESDFYDVIASYVERLTLQKKKKESLFMEAFNVFIFGITLKAMMDRLDESLKNPHEMPRRRMTLRQVANKIFAGP